MGKRQGKLQHRTLTKQTSQNSLVWVARIPRWEREFCYKIGLFRWEDFLEAKKATISTHTIFRKVLEWNDSAAEEAFQTTKTRFYATAINGVSEQPNHAADLYIDRIDWSSDGDDDDDVEEEAVAVEEKEKEQVVKIENIIPTGWEYRAEDFSVGQILTGLIISIPA